MGLVVMENGFKIGVAVHMYEIGSFIMITTK